MLQSSIGHVFTKPINPFMPQASRKKALANSVDPDEMLHDAASHQGLRCLLIGISVRNILNIEINILGINGLSFL